MSASARRMIAVVVLAVPLLACFEIDGVSGPTEVELGEIVEYVVSFRATDSTSGEWKGEIWWDVPRGWVFVSGEYSGVANGVAFSGELTQNPPASDIWAGCFSLTLFRASSYRQSATTALEPPVVVGDTGTATLRFRVGGAPGEDVFRVWFSASVETDENYWCGGSPMENSALNVDVREPSPPITVRRFVPQAGNGPGAGSAVFDSSIISFNPVGSSREIFQSLWPGDWGGQIVLAENPGTLGGGELIEQRLANAFGGAGLGDFGLLQTDFSIVEAGRGPAPMMQALIFATNPDGRRFGQFFQGQPSDAALQAGETGLLFTTHDPERYRVNVGVASMADGTRVVLTPLGAGGVPLAEPVTFRPNFYGINEQFNNISRRWGLGDAANVMVEARVESGAAFVYASVLDGRSEIPGTSDPTTILPVTEGSDRVVLLELGRITGLNEFSGSASVYNHGADPLDVRVDFFERGIPGVSGTASLRISGRETLSWEDAVGDLVGRTEVIGALVFSVEGEQPPGAGLSAIGREFAIFRDADEVSGTAGQAMPGLSDGDMLMPGETFHFLGLREREIALGTERSHLAVFNPGASDATVVISGFADDGTPEGTYRVTARAGELLRVNRVLRAIKPSQDGGLKRIEMTATAPVFALAYRVNPNGDPVTLQPFRR